MTGSKWRNDAVRTLASIRRPKTPFRRFGILLDGYGCDVYIEATGHPAAVEQGLNMIRKLGTFVEFSVMREKVTADWTIIGDSKELNVHGAHLGPYCYPVAIRMIGQGLLPMDEIVTHRLPLADYQKGIDMVVSGLTSVKVTLEP